MSDFWEMTPFELNIYAQGYGERLKTENEITIQNNAVLAYLISRWVWQKKVNIKKYLQNGKQQKPMSDGEMLAKVKALNALFGGKTEKASSQKD